MKRLMIVAGEASGELYGAGLVKALKKKIPEVKIFGMGGERMRGEGVEVLTDIKELSVVGITEVLSHFRSIQGAFNSLIRRLKEERPDAVVLIDFPDFNLRLAERAKGAGIPVIYYISPQVWAWRSGRVKKIARLMDKMLVAFPFEVDIYRKAGVDTEFVGHPILDEGGACYNMPLLSKEEGIKKYNLDPERPVLAMLPGSRKKEVEVLLPIMLGTSDLLKPRGIQTIIPIAPTVDFSMVKEMVKERDIILSNGKAQEILGLSDVALIASGTATLEAAIKGVPMIIIYKVSPITYLLGRLLVKVKNIGLVNILAGREIVPELIQSDVNPEKISIIIKKILDDLSCRERIKKDLLEVREKLGGPGASERAAEAIIRLLSRKLN